MAAPATRVAGRREYLGDLPKRDGDRHLGAGPDAAWCGAHHRRADLLQERRAARRGATCRARAVRVEQPGPGVLPGGIAARCAAPRLRRAAVAARLVARR